MKLTLYHYVHCPFCIRVRMGLGYLGLTYESVVVPYNDETTPVRLTGKKMLPIMEIDGKAMNESLDILEKIDVSKKLDIRTFVSGKGNQELNELLEKLGKNVHNLAMPYWIFTKEFDESSRQYFQSKKEQKRGSFSELVRNRPGFETQLMNDLQNLISELRPYYRSDKLSIADIMLASHLWGLYVVPEFQFPAAVHQYLQRVKADCHFNYHEDF